MEKQIDEKIYVEINGMRQGMFLKGGDAEKPVLLFLHGGPGSPEIAFTQNHPTGLEKLFTVCWWEQRGSCMSYSRNIPKETMTVEQMINDAVAVTDYLRNRFGKEKIYLMGPSWGSMLGVLTVQKAPQLFFAYIGIGQVARQEESERLAYTYMLEQFSAAGDQKMVQKLKKFPIDQGAEIGMKYLGVRSVGMTKLGVGVMHHSTSMMDAVKEVMRFKGYTLAEKIKFTLGGGFSIKHLWGYVLQSDFVKQVPRLDAPVYILQGRYDYQVSYTVAKEYLKALQAPVKGFYTFENSAHSPVFEEPEKFCHILSTDVLQARASLSDSLEAL